MSKPIRHAMSSVKRYNTDLEIPLAIHNLFDSSKSVIADNRHRTLTHHSWFGLISEKVFGVSFPNKAGRLIAVRDIAEDHLSEDHLGYHPTAADYLSRIVMKDWMKPKENITASEHSRRSAEKFGGKPEDYQEIHELIDSSQSVFHDCRHGVLTHQPFFFGVLQRIFGDELINSDNKTVAVFDVCSQHVVDDLGFVPDVSQWLEGMPLEPWMSAKPGTFPPSASNIAAQRKAKKPNGRVVISLQ